ncbi:hypothetical protein Ciccas_010967 [Cichlidogyrus casuarinus]|uniref:Uncharacterized protein n=1 Tax=Cichlidogyrus casuarinus TaxID=1844966 RepID=A0ABD2PUM4_9PLAT
MIVWLMCDPYAKVKPTKLVNLIRIKSWNNKIEVKERLRSIISLYPPSNNIWDRLGHLIKLIETDWNEHWNTGIEAYMHELLEYWFEILKSLESFVQAQMGINLSKSWTRILGESKIVSKMILEIEKSYAVCISALLGLCLLDLGKVCGQYRDQIFTILNMALPATDIDKQIKNAVVDIMIEYDALMAIHYCIVDQENLTKLFKRWLKFLKLSEDLIILCQQAESSYFFSQIKPICCNYYQIIRGEQMQILMRRLTMALEEVEDDFPTYFATPSMRSGLDQLYCLEENAQGVEFMNEGELKVEEKVYKRGLVNPLQQNPLCQNISMELKCPNNQTRLHQLYKLGKCLSVENLMNMHEVRKFLQNLKHLLRIMVTLADYLFANYNQPDLQPKTLEKLLEKLQMSQKLVNSYLAKIIELKETTSALNYAEADLVNCLQIFDVNKVNVSSYLNNYPEAQFI